MVNLLNRLNWQLLIWHCNYTLITTLQALATDTELADWCCQICLWPPYAATGYCLSDTGGFIYFAYL